MKYLYLLLALALSNNLIGQNNRLMTFELTEYYKENFIKIENTAEFFTYSDENTPPTLSINIKIKVTNMGDQAIPDLCVTNRSKYLELWYNDKNSHNLSIMNGLEIPDARHTLLRGESDEFIAGFIFVENSGIETYGNPLRAQWIYMGIKSPVIVIDTEKHVILSP